MALLRRESAKRGRKSFMRFGFVKKLLMDIHCQRCNHAHAHLYLHGRGVLMQDFSRSFSAGKLKVKVQASGGQLKKGCSNRWEWHSVSHTPRSSTHSARQKRTFYQPHAPKSVLLAQRRSPRSLTALDLLSLSQKNSTPSSFTLPPLHLPPPFCSFRFIILLLLLFRFLFVMFFSSSALPFPSHSHLSFHVLLVPFQSTLVFMFSIFSSPLMIGSPAVSLLFMFLLIYLSHYQMFYLFS